MICPFCNIEYDENEFQAFCPHCGKSILSQLRKINKNADTYPFAAHLLIAIVVVGFFLFLILR